MISLIANSGIQLVPVEVEIDLNDSDHVLFFHEWAESNKEGAFESKLELVTCLPKLKLYYKQKELERLKMINPATGEIAEEKEERVVQAALNESKVEHLGKGDIKDNEELFKIDASTAEEMLQDFTNRWMPMPFYEQGQGNGDLGPYDWCRMKLIPHESPEEAPEGPNLFKATLLLAFDTHATYLYKDKKDKDKNDERPKYDLCPVFEEGSRDKTFAIPNGTSLLLDYILSGEKWVSNGLMEMKYGTKNIGKVRRNPRKREFRYTYLATYIWLLDHLRRFAGLPTVTLMRDRGEESVNVDMVIDIGNSRTAAIFCEDGESDFSNAKPLVLQNWTHPVTSDGRLNRTEESFDMRVAFQKVDFGDFNDGCQFVWPSMVRLGSEARELTFQTCRLAKGDEKYSTCSSPKRYLWDTQQLKKNEEWCQVSLGVDGRAKPPTLPGISAYFNDDGTLNKEGKGGSGCQYSRRALMTFAMMEIVAQTHAQINSYEYRHSKGREQSGRKLHRIILTCPTGMSKEEQVALHDCLRDALYVLDRFFFGDIKPSDGSAMPVSVDVDIVPNLGDTDSPQWMYDEATCSQFVYLYGLLTETYKNCTTDLFKAYGKERDGKQSLVVGSLDIGAGTSDIMIARYDAPSSPDSARLAPIPLFWDSFDTAGDDMLHDLIQNVLIQGADGQLEQLMINADGLHLTENEARGRLFSFFGRNQQDHEFNDKIMRRDFTLQVLVPLMYEFLRLHEDGMQEYVIRFAEFFTTTRRPSPEVLEHFHNRIGLRAEDIEWHFDRSVLDKHILGSSIQKVVKQVAELMCASDCDVVLLSGRPSSLQPLVESFRRSAPRLTGKIVILNNHDIGDWFPFINKAKRSINNSKSIVPVGAFIGYKSSHGGLNGFSIDMEHLAKDIQPTTDYFIVNDAIVKSRAPFIMKGEKRCEMTVYSLPARIGAQQLNIPGYPVRPFYVLSINEDGIRDRIKSSSAGGDPDNGTLKERVDRQVAQITAHFPLKFNFNRDLKNKEVLEIEKVADSTKEELSADDFCLSIQSLNDPDFYWLDMGVYEINQGVDRK